MTQIPQSLSKEQTKALLNNIDADFGPGIDAARSTRNYVLTLLMLDAGLRVSEACSLTQSQLVLNDCVLSGLHLDADQTKTSQCRHIPFTTRLQQTIQRLHNLTWLPPNHAPGLYAFFYKSGTKALSPRSVQDFIRAASKNIPGGPFHPHQLRHTFATNMLKVCDMATLQSLLGHSHLSSTQRYLHPGPDDRQAAITALDAQTQS